MQELPASVVSAGERYLSSRFPDFLLFEEAFCSATPSNAGRIVAYLQDTIRGESPKFLEWSLLSDAYRPVADEAPIRRKHRCGLRLLKQAAEGFGAVDPAEADEPFAVAAGTGTIACSLESMAEKWLRATNWAVRDWGVWAVGESGLDVSSKVRATAALALDSEQASTVLGAAWTLARLREPWQVWLPRLGKMVQSPSVFSEELSELYCASLPDPALAPDADRILASLLVCDRLGVVGTVLGFLASHNSWAVKLAGDLARIADSDGVDEWVREECARVLQQECTVRKVPDAKL